MINFRNLLFIPAVESKLKKVIEINNDVFIFDLEDSILKIDKEEALTRLKNFLKNNYKKSTEEKWIVRINLENYFYEINFLKDLVDGFLIPKVESVTILRKTREIIGKKILLALLETPMGIINLENIVSSSEVDGIVFGAEDFTSSVNMKNIEENLISIKIKMILYGKAYNKKIFDTPSFEINDLKKLKKDIENTRDLGFDGKLLIHPKQIIVMNEVYNYNYEEIREIIKAFEENKKGVLKYKNKIYEIVHIKQLKKILEGEKK